jgi:predicted O-methyltransferase YrrM
MLKKLSNRHFRKLYKIIYKEISLIKNPKILEFGVSEKAMSTNFFLNFCKLNDGILYSVDINDYSKKFSSSNWKFIRSRDDNFLVIEKNVENKLNIIYLDTLHKADHIEKIFYYYYPKLVKGGFFLVDDISWLPYVKESDKEHFYMERNHEESFNRILEIFYSNRDNFDLEFSFIGTGAAKITKLSNNSLLKLNKIPNRQYSLQNFLRKIYLNLFKKIF